MSLTREALANIRYRLEQLQRDIDADPNLKAIRITVTIGRSHRVHEVFVSLERSFDAAPEGVVVAAVLDNGKPA